MLNNAGVVAPSQPRAGKAARFRREARSLLDGPLNRRLCVATPTMTVAWA